MTPVSNSANKQVLWAGLLSNPSSSQVFTACGSFPPETTEKRIIFALAAASVAIGRILGCHKDLNFHEEIDKLKEQPNRRPRFSSISRARSLPKSSSYTTNTLMTGRRRGKRAAMPPDRK